MRVIWPIAKSCLDAISEMEVVMSCHESEEFVLSSMGFKASSRRFVSAMMENRIKLASDNAGVKNRFYLPYWA